MSAYWDNDGNILYLRMLIFQLLQSLWSTVQSCQFLFQLITFFLTSIHILWTHTFKTLQLMTIILQATYINQHFTWTQTHYSSLRVILSVAQLSMSPCSSKELSLGPPDFCTITCFFHLLHPRPSLTCSFPHVLALSFPPMTGVVYLIPKIPVHYFHRLYSSFCPLTFSSCDHNFSLNFYLRTPPLHSTQPLRFLPS